MQGGLRERAPAGVRLIETMLWEPDGPQGPGVRRLALHLARLAAGCAALGVVRPAGAVEALLDAVRAAAPLRLRLTLGLDGVAALEQGPLPPAKALWRVGLGAARLRADDPWRAIKSTERGIYDAARAALPAGLDELVFVNERGEVAEGTISTLFLWREGVWLTPPCTSGALPGVLRAEMLASGLAREAVLRPEDLARGRLCMGNALRGRIAAQWVPESG